MKKGQSRYLSLLVLLLAGTLRAEPFVPEFPSTVELPAHDGHEWFWLYGFRAPNQGDSRAFLMGEKGEALGQLSMGFWGQSLHYAKSRGEIIALETYFARGTRGDRTDLVVLYDEKTLLPNREIIIPPKRMNAVRAGVTARLTEDERFLLVVNHTPAQSVTIVDLASGEFVEEAETPGCSSLFDGGARDFYAICGNGSFLHLKLDDTGHVIERSRSESLFDAVNDFLTVSGSKIGDTWYFVSRQNNIYGIRMTPDGVSVAGKWPLVSDSEREDGWQIAGLSHTAAHRETGRFYVLVGQAEPHEFEAPGSEVWVFETVTMTKTGEISMEEPTLSIDVSQGSSPKLYALDFHIPLNMGATLWMALMEGEDSLLEVIRQRANVYSAISGEHLFSSEMIPGGMVTGIRAW